MLIEITSIPWAALPWSDRMSLTIIGMEKHACPLPHP